MTDAIELSVFSGPASDAEAEPEDPRINAFRRAWSRKESFVKARGDGLAFELARAEFKPCLRPVWPPPPPPDARISEHDRRRHLLEEHTHWDCDDDDEMEEGEEAAAAAVTCLMATQLAEGDSDGSSASAACVGYTAKCVFFS